MPVRTYPSIRNRSRRGPSLALLAACTATVACVAPKPLFAGTTWTGGGGADRSVSNPANWGGALPATNGTVGVTFGTVAGGTIVNLDTSPFFTTLLYNGTQPEGFTTSGTGSLILRSLNSSSSPNFTTAGSVAGTNTISSSFLINTNNADANKLFVIRNNSPRTTVITGPVGRSADSNVNYQIRFDGAVGSVFRFAGAVTSLDAIQPSGTAWAGDLVFASNQALGSTSITVPSTIAPATTARLVLGEDPAHVQSWGNTVLNNRLNIVVGGTISMASVTGTGAAGITGTAGGTLILTGSNASTFSSVNLAGPLTLIKNTSAALTLQGVKTYTGPTTVNAGTLTLASGASIASNVTINSPAAIAGQGATSGRLSFAAGTTSLIFDPTVPASSLSAAQVNLDPSARVLVSAGAATTLGSTYNVLKLTGSNFGTSVPAGFVAASRGTLGLAASNTILTITPAAPASLTWAGTSANPNQWNVIGDANWTSGGPDVYYNNDSVSFTDTAAVTDIVVATTGVLPAAQSFSNATKTYNLSGGPISAGTTLTKSGPGLVVVANNYSNSAATGISLTGGELRLLGATNSVTGDISVVGGRLVTGNGALGPAGGTKTIILSDGTLSHSGATLAADNYTTALSGNNLIEVTTPGNTVRFGGPVSGTGSLTVAGTGTFTFSRNANVTLGNTYAGTISVRDGGTLEIRNPDSLGDTAAGTTVGPASLLAIYPFGQTVGATFNAEPLTFQDGAALNNHIPAAATALNNTLTGPITTQGVTRIVSQIDPGGVAAEGSATLTFTGGISGTGGLAFGGTLPSFGSASTTGTYVLAAGAFNYAGDTTVSANSVVIAQQPLRPVTGSLVVTGPGVAILRASANVSNATIAGQFSGVTVTAGGSVTLSLTDRTTGNKPKVLVTSALSITGGTLDLTNNDLLVRGGNFAAVRDAVAAWYASGTFAGTTGLISSAGAGASGLATLAVVDNTVLGLTKFDTVDVGAGDVLVKYTYLGDTDLDGEVTTADLTRLIKGIRSGGTLTGWSYGDTNYDGVVNGVDYANLLTALRNQGSPLGNSGLSVDDPGIGTGAGVIPEPGALGLLLAGVPLIGRRHRSEGSQL